MNITDSEILAEIRDLASKRFHALDEVHYSSDPTKRSEPNEAIPGAPQLTFRAHGHPEELARLMTLLGLEGRR
jgi:hypothetical protein